MVCFVKLAVLSPPRKLHFCQRTHRLSAKSSGALKLVEARGALVTGLVLLLLCCQLQQTMVSALSCEPCDVATCVNDTNCPGGMVLGPCRCCYECARQVNQSCGGIYDLSGTCDKNLHCVRPLSEDVTSEESLVGICMEIPEMGCSGQNCPPAYIERLCPPDSSVAFKTRKSEDPGSADTSPRPPEDAQVRDVQSKASQPHGEAPEMNHLDLPSRDSTLYCVCNMSACHIPSCARGFTLRLLQNATGLPGTCCDVYECQRSNDCPSTMCPPIEEEPCPEDSVRLMPMWTDDHCCEVQQGCSCPIENKCEDVECPVGYHLDVISEATGLPGSCCTKFTCIPEFFLTCKFNGKEMRNGEVWKADECRTCTCNNGVSKCTRRTCPGPNCSYMVYIEGECCPVCRGCVSESGQVHNESDTWKENDCTTCTCRNGKAECQAEMCAVECLKPKRVPGQCCSVCEETCNLFCPFGFKLDSQGNSLCVCSEDKCAAFKEQKCDKHCEYGYKTTRDGCVKCKCNKCPQLECTKRCTHGYALNDEGCPLCKCKESYTPGLISTEHQRGDGRQCMSQQGSRYVNGESWNDGCRKCYCHNGLEMCSLLACPAPICNHPVFRVGDCCPTCPGLTVPELEGEGEKCQSAEGHHYVEGETWQMDSCTLCVCHGGNILCQTSSCPPVVCHHPVKPEGQCCAICRGDDLSSLPVAGHHHCRSPTSMMYKHGETWQSTPCQSCTCLDGQIICYNQVCPAVSCNKTVLKKGQCCPTCVEAAKAQFCVYNNVTYDSGEKWQGDNCTQCVCVHGKKECFPMSCPSLDCTFGVIKMSGQCCLECYDGPKPEATVHNSTYEQQVYTNSDTSEHGEEKSTFNATAFGFSMLALALGLIIVIGVLVRILILKSRQYRSRPNDQNVENQRNLLQNENKMYWPVKFTPVKAPDIVNKNRSSNDYTEMDFSDGSKGSYRPAVNS